MQTDLTNVDDLLDGMCAFVDRYVMPLEKANETLIADPRRRYSEDGSYSPEMRALKRDVRMRAAEAGFFTMCVPKALGGSGQGPLLHFLSWERLYHRYGMVNHLPYETLSHWSRGPSHIFAQASASLKDRVLPGLMSGQKSICFSLSEPDAGSDPWNMRTVATPVDGGWVIDGTKQWSTNGPTADYALVFAITNKEVAASRRGGVTAFLVDSSSDGYRVDSTLKLFGAVGGDEAIISLNSVFVTPDQVVGHVDDGFTLALSGISLGRMFNAGRAVGMSRWAIELAVKYAKERVTFGNPLSEYQGIQFIIADAATKIYAARSIALDCARKLESGHAVRKELAMVKAFTTESSFEVIDACMQVLGGMGLTNEVGLYEAWHNARISRIADGSGEIMRRTIAKKIFQGNFDF